MVISLLLLSVLHAQTEQIIIDRIINQLRAFPQEKTYAHTDATDYAPGERIWLKVYVVKALSHEPQSESLYAYVELTAPDNTVISKAKLLCRDGIYAGNLKIPTSAKGGCYWLRTYTELSKNTPLYASTQPIYIGGRATENTTLQQSTTKSATESDKLIFNRKENRIVVRTTLDNDSLLLLAHCRAYPFAISSISQSKPVVFDADSLPQGVVALLLLNKKLQVLDERLLLSDNGSEQCRISINTDQTEYSTGNPVQLSLNPQKLHDGERVDVSISVTAPTPYHRHRPSSIVGHLMIATDVEGGTDNPEQYLGHAERADSMLASCRWKRYDFNRLLSGDYELPTYECETTQTIKGQVKTLFRHRPVKGAMISLISPQAGCIATAVTGEDGFFTIPGMDYADGTQYVLRATNAKGRESVELEVFEPNRPDFPVIKIKPTEVWNMDMNIDFESDSLLAFYTDGILLKNVQVMGTRRNPVTGGNVFNLTSDVTLNQNKIEEIDATCLHELMRHIAGLRIVKFFDRETNSFKEKIYMRGATSINDDNPARIAIDGVLVDEDYDLHNIQMQDVARVDVFKTGSALIWGTTSGGGVISITTKRGQYEDTETEQFNQKKITPQGYQRASSFSSQIGQSKTLYWNPNVTSQHIELNASDVSGKCHVVVEGVTSEGRLIHEERDILVKP